MVASTIAMSMMSLMRLWNSPLPSMNPNQAWALVESWGISMQKSESRFREIRMQGGAIRVVIGQYALGSDPTIYAGPVTVNYRYRPVKPVSPRFLLGVTWSGYGQPPRVRARLNGDIEILGVI